MMTNANQNLPLDEQLSFYIKGYLHLTPAEKRIVQYIFSVWNHTKTIFPSVSRICRICRCGETTYKKFFRKWGNLLLDRGFRFTEQGRQTSNNFIFNPTFLKALRWLELYGFLRAKKESYNRIISSIENEEKVPPPPPKKVPPYSWDSSLVKIKSNYVAKNPLLGGEKIPEEAMIYLEKTFSSHVLVEMMASFRYNKARNLIRTTPQAWMIGTAKRIRDKYRERFG